jgi:hypothetical protein
MGEGRGGEGFVTFRAEYLNTFFVNLWYVVVALWGVGMAIHTVQYLSDVGKERAVQRAIEREHEYRMLLAQRGEVYEKPKRDRLILNDDGEIETLADEDAPARRLKK